MLKKLALVAAAATTSMVAMPAAAEAQRYGYYDSRYDRGYDSRYDRYDRNDRYNSRYDNSRYNDRYYGRNYNNRYYGSTHRRCSGTTGTIVGGVAGALLGREVTRNTRSYNRNSGTTGAIIGGAIGALAGRAIDKSNC